MGKVTGFLEIDREQPTRRKVEERLKDWFEIYEPFPEEKQRAQGARCMDCGVPFCHTGCPVNNLIPDWNDLVYNGRWEAAVRRLHATNNFPEFTGRICPAPCEAACVLGIDQPPVSIKLIERSVVERAWDEGWIGLLRYGIPNFKLEKHVIDRRIQQMRAEGVTFVTNAHVGVNVPVETLTEHYDAILLAGGSEHPRDLNIPGRELKGIHFAMEFLPQQNRRCEGDVFDEAAAISAKEKRVLIIGGGDTGADCLGTSLRQGARSVHQFEIMPKPPEIRAASTPWPLWPLQLRTESSHEEGGLRDWSINSVRFTGDQNGNVKQLHALRVGPPPKFEAIPGSEFTLDFDLVLLAMGFLGPVRSGMIEQLGVALDQRGNVATADYKTSVDGIFAAGDMRRGQSLVVWAISEGRKAAAAVDDYLAAKDEPLALRHHALV